MERLPFTPKLGSRVELVTFKVVERLSTQVISGCYFCDNHFEAIRPRKRCVELILCVSNCRCDAVPLPEEQKLVPSSKRICNKFLTAQTAVLKPGQQYWVTVKSKATGFGIIEPNGRLLATRYVSLQQAFTKLLPNFRSVSSLSTQARCQSR